MSDDLNKAKTVSARTVAGLQRWVCGLVAVLGLAGGGVAVYRSTNQAGTVALLTIGAFAALFCLIGSVPLRWTVGTASFDLSETVEVIVDAVSTQLDAEQLRAASAEIRIVGAGGHDADGITRRLADGLASASQFEILAQGRLVEAARSLGWDYRPQVVLRRRRRDDRSDLKFEADGLLVTGVGRQIAVEMKTSTNTSRVFASVRQMSLLLEAGVVDGGFIAVNGSVPKEIADYLAAGNSRIIAMDLARIPIDLIASLQILSARMENAGPDR